MLKEKPKAQGSPNVVTTGLTPAALGPGAVPVSPRSAGLVGDHVRKTLYWTAFATVALVVLDAAIAVVAFPLAYSLRSGGSPVLVWPDGQWLPSDVTNGFRPYLSILLVLPFVRFLCSKHYGLYKLRGEFALLTDAMAILKSVSVGTLVIVLFAFLYRGGFVYRDYSYSRFVFVLDWAMVLASLAAVRVAVRGAQIVSRRRDRNLIRTLIVGDGELAKLSVQEISENARLGYHLVGVVTARDGADAACVEGLPVLGAFDSLPALIRQHGIEEVLITDTALEPQALFEAIMRSGRTHRVNFRVVPNMFNCLPRKTEADQIGSLPMIRLFGEPLAGPSRLLKRSIDIAGSVAIIAVTSPVWAVLAWLIKRESPGPVFHSQERVGMDGKVFPMFKFRSMRQDADSPENIVAHQEAMRRNITGDVTDGKLHGKVENDPRVTRVGNFMRRYSIDELPQMLNVLRGDMSLVGPRPPISYEVEMYADWHRGRFHVKPGITGLWQVSGRNRLPFQEMVQLDIYYIENWSLWLDIGILLRTLPVVLRGDNTN